MSLSAACFGQTMPRDLAFAVGGYGARVIAMSGLGVILLHGTLRTALDILPEQVISPSAHRVAIVGARHEASERRVIVAKRTVEVSRTPSSGRTETIDPVQSAKFLSIFLGGKSEDAPSATVASSALNSLPPIATRVAGFYANCGLYCDRDFGEPQRAPAADRLAMTSLVSNPFPGAHPRASQRLDVEFGGSSVLDETVELKLPDRQLGDKKSAKRSAKLAVKNDPKLDRQRKSGKSGAVVAVLSSLDGKKKAPIRVAQTDLFSAYFIGPR